METSHSERLAKFLGYLKSLTARPPANELREQIEASGLTAEDFLPHVKFQDSGYCRNLVFESERAQLLCLCWGSGQRSPIHDHARSICGVKVLQGIATETIFETSPCGQLKPGATNDYEAGLVLVSEDSDTHQVSNLQSADADPLITMHVYSPPLHNMETFSIDPR